MPSGLTCSVLQTGAHLGLNINKYWHPISIMLTQIYGGRHPLLLIVPSHDEGHSRGEVVEALAAHVLRLLADLGLQPCLGS